MRAAALVLLLSVPAAAGTSHYPSYFQHPYRGFIHLVGLASDQMGLASPPSVRQGSFPAPDQYDGPVLAWVEPPLPIIWISPAHLDAEIGDLCDTAYHEVCHLWLHQEGVLDLRDHEALVSCMERFKVAQVCENIEGPY